MTAPRQIVPGRVSMITRRCTQRQYMLRPDETTRELFAYCIAEAASRFNIGLIAWLVMSNHYHAVVYDPDGRLPEFTEHLHKMVARVFNRRWERRENFWSTAETCVTHLPTAEDVLRKVIYTLANPVSAELVEHVAGWPGLSSLEHLQGKRTVHRRPEFFFSAKGKMPESVELEMMLPAEILELTTREMWAQQVRAALDTKERAAAEARRREGRKVMTLKEVLNASPFESPYSKETQGGLRPALARRDREDRVRDLERLTAFRVAHAAARRRYIEGDRDVLFPDGTYRMRRWGAKCVDPIPIAA